MSAIDDNYNPFQRLKRTRTLFIELDNNRPFEDPTLEPVFSQFLRRATRRFTYNPIFIRRHPPSLPRVEPIPSHDSRADEENASNLEPTVLAPSVDRNVPFFAHLHSRWRQMTTRLPFNEQLEVKPAIAKIAQLTLANAPLGTKGKVLLQAFARPNRRSRALVVEYSVPNPSADGNSM